MNHPTESTYSGTEYDIKSIMQYGKRTFVTSVGGVFKNTIESKFDPNMDIGNSELSKIDIIELNKLYQCHGIHLPFNFFYFDLQEQQE